MEEKSKECDLVATLVFLLKGKKVYLATKKAKIGKKRLNGPGGKLELQDASIKACAVREVRQEFHVLIEEKELELCAIGFFTNVKDDGTLFACKVYIFIAKHWIGIPKASKEMGKPKLVSIYKMPYEKMMAADKFWIPLVLVKKRKIFVRALLKNGQSELVGDVEIVDMNVFE